MNYNNRGFTLVELIVVITILSILGTIAFISMQGYSKNSRDSIRIGDLANIELSFKLFYNNNSKYPETTSGTVITYLGYEAWTQGIIGSTTIKNLDNLSKIPKDPLTFKEYSYSLTSNKQEYQIAGILESNNFGYNNIFLEKTYTEGNVEGISFVVGNFNGRILQVKGDNKIYILAIPSIISSDLSDTNLINIIENKKIIFNNFKNLPSNYEGSKYIVEGETDLNLVNASKIEVFSGTINDLQDENVQISLIKRLQEAYSGTVINKDYLIDEIFSYNVEANPEGTKFLSQTILKNNITKSIKINAKNVNYSYQCDGLVGINGEYPAYNLCDNIKIESISNINKSTNLTNHAGNRDVYLIELEGGKEYVFEILGDDYDSDTHMSLYDDKGNLLIKNDDIAVDVRRSKFVYNTTYTGYYYVGIMGRHDGGTVDDYTLDILKSTPCAQNPGYNNAEYIEGGNNVEGKAWQNINKFEGCYYHCINGYTGYDCSEKSSCLSDLTENGKDILNIAFNDDGYNGNIDYWCGLMEIYVANSDTFNNIPPELGNLINLEGLYLVENNQLTGEIPPELGNLINLKELSLYGNQLTGEIPSELGNLINLEILYLGDNPGMSGSIPSELGNLTNLKELYLRQMGLSGIIPNNFFNLTKLENLWLNRNNFNGNISSSFGQLTNLIVLWISNSYFTGEIPPELGNLTNLEILGLKENNLTGEIPSELGNLTKLRELRLESNQLTGEIPSELGNLTNLNLLYFYNNNLLGAGLLLCNTIKDSIRNWNSPDSSVDNDEYGEYRDNPQDSDNDGNYDDIVNFCP